MGYYRRDNKDKTQLLVRARKIAHKLNRNNTGMHIYPYDLYVKLLTKYGVAF